MTAPTPTDRATAREVVVSWGADYDGMRCLQVECDDELTRFMFVGRPVIDESDPEAIVAGPLARMAVEEHRSRCDACKAWAAS